METEEGRAETPAALCERHLGLAHHCARRFIGRGAAYEDLFQQACAALTLAAARFDASRGAAFSTYAVPCVLGELRRYCGQMEEGARHRAWLLREDEDGDPLEEVADPSAEGRMEAVLLADFVERMPKPLPELVRCRFVERLSQMETARRLGLHQTTVSRLEGKVRAWVRAAVE